MKQGLLLRGLLLLSMALGASGLAQDDNPVSVRVEIFAVSQVGGEETFTETTTARPGQVYRVPAVCPQRGGDDAARRNRFCDRSGAGGYDLRR